MTTRDPNSLTNSIMQMYMREMKKQADIDIYGARYNATRAILFGMISADIMSSPKKVKAKPKAKAKKK